MPVTYVTDQECSRGGSRDFERGATLHISLLMGGAPFRFWCLVKVYFKNIDHDFSQKGGGWGGGEKGNQGPTHRYVSG